MSRQPENIRTKATNVLQASEERLRYIMEQNADAILVLDYEKVVRFVNPAAEALFQRKADELLSEPFSFPVVLGEKGEIEIPRKNGETATAEIHIINMEWEGGPACLVSMRDITNHKQMERELWKGNAFLRSILESPSSVSIISTDPEGNVLYWNSGAERIFGYRAKDVIGARKIDILYTNDEESRAKLAAVRDTLFDDKKEASCELVEMTKDGDKLWVKLMLTPMLDVNGEVMGILGIGEDITERKRADRMKDEIISIVSHEIKSPLTSVLNALSLVSGGDTGELTPPMKRMIDIAYRNSKRLLRMANSMLDIRKIESGRMEFYLEPVELMAVVEQTVGLNQTYAKELDVELVITDALPDARVNVDSDCLMQVLTNLLTNAAKFSPPDGQVAISVSRRDELLRVAVMDHGPGIPKEHRDRIFQEFVQAHTLGERQKSGSGLGLSIAKALIEDMGGQIGFETEIDVGTTFYFDLPEYYES